MEIINGITNEQALNAIQVGEFSSEIINSNEFVVVVLTQDWCPQWVNMSRWIYSAAKEKKVKVYTFVYNKADCFREFMKFKETKWQNFEIPYLRFYKNGELVKETNYLYENVFIDTIAAL